MQVTLTPQDPKDPPMTFELEDGGSLSLGGIEAGAQLSWDLLGPHFQTNFHREGGKLNLRPEAASSLLIDGSPPAGESSLQDGQVISMGELVCKLSIHQEEAKPLPAPSATPAPDDDIFGDGKAPAQLAGDAPTKASGVSVETSKWLFKVLTGPNAGAQMGLEDGKIYTIGSDSQSCNIVLTDLSVSKQHLKLSVFASGEMVIEDLKSRNGVLINGEKIEEKSKQTSSAIITAGATTFMVVDRTSEQKTIVTTSLPVKERVSSEKNSTSGESTPVTAAGVTKAGAPDTATPKKKGRGILVGSLMAVALLLGFGFFSLFDAKVVTKEARPAQTQEIAAVLEEYPYFEYSFNDSTAVLTLTGHILTVKDKRQLLSKLSQIELIRRVDDTNLIVDEIVWQQFNMALEKTFSGISLSATSPGEFILTGTLDNGSQAEILNRYLQVNFPYNDNLQNKVIVLEQLITSVNEKLQSIAPGELLAELQHGELMIVGTVPSSRAQDFHSLIEQLKSTPGLRSIRNLVIEQSTAEDGGLIDLSSSYNVSGFSKASDANTSVMINGRILQRGDTLDGMTIVSIRAKQIVLDRDGIKYRISYNS